MPQDTTPNQCLLLHSVKNLSLSTTPTPTLTSPHDVLVRIAETGICMSDVHYWQRGHIGSFALTTPIILGHESAGTVTAVGSAVSTLKPGDRVAIEPGVPCRRCDSCRAGAYNLCADTVFAATPPHDGTLARIFRTAADYCYPLPPQLGFEAAALCEPVAVAVQVCKVAGVKLGQRVAVFGCGPIGLLCQAVAKASGAAFVLGIDVSKRRLAFARDRLKCADAVFEPPAREAAVGQGGDAGAGAALDAEVELHARVAERMREEFGLGEGPDVVLEATGAQACIQTGLQLVRKGGVYVQAGMGRENVTVPITTVCIRDLTIRGSIRYTAGCYKTAIDLVASGRIDPTVLITHRFAFEDGVKAFETVRKGGEDVLKVMISGVKD